MTFVIRTGKQQFFRLKRVFCFSQPTQWLAQVTPHLNDTAVPFGGHLSHSSSSRGMRGCASSVHLYGLSVREQDSDAVRPHSSDYLSRWIAIVLARAGALQPFSGRRNPRQERDRSKVDHWPERNPRSSCRSYHCRLHLSFRRVRAIIWIGTRRCEDEA
jgi:hypothetical protein